MSSGDYDKQTITRVFETIPILFITNTQTFLCIGNRVKL